METRKLSGSPSNTSLSAPPENAPVKPEAISPRLAPTREQPAVDAAGRTPQRQGEATSLAGYGEAVEPPLPLEPDDDLVAQAVQGVAGKEHLGQAVGGEQQADQPPPVAAVEAIKTSAAPAVRRPDQRRRRSHTQPRPVGDIVAEVAALAALEVACAPGEPVPVAAGQGRDAVERALAGAQVIAVAVERHPRRRCATQRPWRQRRQDLRRPGRGPCRRSHGRRRRR